MPKLICYALFDNGNKELFEKRSYIRGFYWNARMNNLLYPDWRTHLEVDEATFNSNPSLFEWLVRNNNLSLVINKVTPPLCEGMLWRMKPVFTMDVTHVLCRDADAVTTYREALMVQEWLESYQAIHAIHDNPAHDGLMGGMIGIVTSRFKAVYNVTTWEEMIKGLKLDQHGSDQHFLNREILPRFRNEIFWHKPGHKLYAGLPQVNKKYWESDLTCRHIGSPGVVEMELRRFFIRHDEYNWKFQEIEKAHPHLFGV